MGEHLCQFPKSGPVRLSKIVQRPSALLKLQIVVLLLVTVIIQIRARRSVADLRTLVQSEQFRVRIDGVSGEKAGRHSHRPISALSRKQDRSLRIIDGSYVQRRVRGLVRIEVLGGRGKIERQGVQGGRIGGNGNIGRSLFERVRQSGHAVLQILQGIEHA